MSVLRRVATARVATAATAAVTAVATAGVGGPEVVGAEAEGTGTVVAAVEAGVVEGEIAATGRAVRVCL